MIVQPPLAGESAFVQQLHAIWDQFAALGPAHLERLLRVESWYLDGRYVPFLDEHRNVLLGDDFWTWETSLVQRWNDFVIPGVEVDFVIVTPSPSTAATPLEVHILLYQRITDLDRPRVVTVRDNGVLQGMPYTAAVVLPSAVTKAAIISHMGKSIFCPPQRNDAVCSCWHGALAVGDYPPFPNRNGFSFDLHVYRPLASVWDEAQADIPDSHSWLQTAQHLHAPAGTPDARASESDESIGQTIEFEPAIRSFEWLDSHFFLPCYDLPSLPCTHVAKDWTSLWWDLRTPCLEIRIYTDGSFVKSPAQDEASAGAAVAAFALLSHGWVFAGALSSVLPNATSSYVSELSALTAAVKLAYDILKVHHVCFGYAPPVNLCHDATTVGRQADGSWRCVSHPLLGRALRSLVLLAEARFDAQLSFQHVSGHSGEPGNELVDFLAQDARHGNALGSFADWLDYITARDFVQAAEWTWMLFSSVLEQRWHGTAIVFPEPATSPTFEVLPAGQAACSKFDVEEDVSATISLRCATCNVLTLKGAKDSETGISGIARQRALLAQMAQEKVCIFGLQETRLQKLHASYDDDFFLYKSAATQAGHGGTIIGFSRKQPYGRVCPGDSSRERKLYFKDEHITVVAFDPRFLLLRVQAPYLRVLVLTAHAPHSGNDYGSIAQWWHDLGATIPPAFSEWPLVLLCDANASVGGNTSVHIGGHQAGKLEEKASPFEDFVAQHDLWLPATFEHCQQGDGATWTHTTGHCRRIDYVALPRRWQSLSCSAWVSSVIDPSLLRPDHAAACVAIEFPASGSSRPYQSKNVRLDTLKVDQIVWANCPFRHPLAQDVHSHLAELQHSLVCHLRGQCGVRKRKPVKQTMSDQTWQLVCEKRAC